MNGHFDLSAAEATMRANVASAAAESQAMVDAGKADPQFLAAQREFDEARIQFTLACMRAENAGVGRNEILSAAGFTLGTLWGSVLRGCVGARERAMVNGWVQMAMRQIIGQAPADKTIEAVFSPMPGSRA
jgi:hypothetical protein